MTLSDGNPAFTNPSRNAAATTMFEEIAPEEPRRNAALPDFTQRPAASLVTFGLFSYTIATTPSGTRTRRTRKPFGRTHPSATSPTGSGNDATLRRPAAIASTRAGVSRSRSTIAADEPAASAVGDIHLVRVEQLVGALDKEVGRRVQAGILRRARHACEHPCCRLRTGAELLHG